MATKKELSEEINEVLGTDMEWERMLQDDLELFHDLITSGDFAEPMVKQYTKEYGSSKLEREIDSWYPGKFAGKLL